MEGGGREDCEEEGGGGGMGGGVGVARNWDVSSYSSWISSPYGW